VHDDLVRHGNELVRGLLDGLAPRHLRVGLGDDRLREGEESRFHVLPGLRGTQEAGHAEGFLEIVQLLLSLPSRIGEVHLVPDDSIRRSFFVTFVPIVVMYSSENLSTTKRRIRLVLPTAPSPTRRILRLMWSSTIAVPLHAGPTLITLAGSMSSLRIQGSRSRKSVARMGPAVGPL